jgi:hypothetical protein
MDEEKASYQQSYEYVVVRQHELWWHDFMFLMDQVEKAGSRAWIWSDYVWEHQEQFVARMPKSVIQSNWYYGLPFNREIGYVKAYHDLEDHGYDQIPTGSNFDHPENFEKTVNYCTDHISPERLMGFLQTPWKPTLMVFRDHHIQAIDAVSIARYGKS